MMENCDSNCASILKVGDRRLQISDFRQFVTAIPQSEWQLSILKIANKIVHRSYKLAIGGYRFRNRSFHFTRILSCSDLLASATAGKSCRWLKGRQASMIALELKGVSSGYVTYIGSFFDPMPRWMMSMLVTGSERVATAHITSCRLDGSMSSSTTTE